MKVISRIAALLAVGVILCVGGLVAGCKGDAQFSKQEMNQFQQGPSKEMPPEARQAFERAKQGSPPQAGPPAGK